MRNLIMQLYCSRCGSLLSAEYGEVKQHEDAPGLPGGVCRYSRVQVEPCRECMERELGPARKLAAAVKQLMD